MKIIYVEADSMTVQGKEREIYKKYGKEWHISELGGGCGNFLLTKRADVLVDGKSCRDFVLDHYNRKKLTEKLFNKFKEDVNSGKIKFPS